MIPLLLLVLSRAERPQRHHNTPYYRHFRFSTMLLYTALADVLTKTAALFSEAQLLDRMLARLSVILPLGAGIA